MDPIRLQIENFCRHANSDISFLDFSSALIVGKAKGSDKISNGVGKSTIFSAIKYVLFNEVESSTLDKVIRHGTDRCKVVFDFVSAMDGEKYRITRSKGKRTGSEVLLHKLINDTWENISQRRNPDTEKEIAKLIKINYKTFCNSILFSQSDLSGLASLRPEKRKLALKEALQLNIYSKYETVAKKRAIDLLKDIDKEKIILSTLGDPLKDIEAININLKSLEEKLADYKNKLSQIAPKYDTEVKEHVLLTKKLESMDKESEEILVKQTTIWSDIAYLTNLCKDYNKKISFTEDAGKVLSSEIKQLTQTLNALSDLKFRNKSTIAEEIDGTTKTIIDKKASFNSKSAKLEELKIPLPTGSTCKYCRQKINFANKEERDACQQVIDNDIVNLQLALSNDKNDISRLENISLSLRSEIKSIEEHENKIISIKNTIDSKSKELEVKRSLYTEYSASLANNSKNLSDKNKDYAALIQLKTSFSPEEYNNLKLAIKDKKLNMDAINKEIQDIRNRVVSESNSKAVFLHRVEERQKDMEKIKTSHERIFQLGAKYAVHQKVVEAFGSAGIPALIIHTILDDFQIETNLWLSKLRPGLQLQFSVIKDRSDGDQEDTLDIGYILDGYDMEYALLSGAQKFIVALSLKLGLASVIKKRLGVDMHLLLIDEVDQCLDEGTLEAFESAIKQLQQDFKVLVITHNNELKTKFNHAILVEQDENLASRAKVVNTW